MTFKGKEVLIVLSEEASEEYNELNRIVGAELQRGVNSSIHQSIFRSIERVKIWLKENPFTGDQVKKSQIPNYYVEKVWRNKSLAFKIIQLLETNIHNTIK